MPNDFNHMKSLWAPFSYIVILVALTIFPVSAANKSADKTADSKQQSGGYYLLHKVCEDESNVSMLMMVKHAPKEIETFANRISKTAKESTASLEHMQKGDETIQFEQSPLPQIELDVRESIHDDKEHQLLFGTSGPEFVRTFLVSQIEASTYAMNLAKVLSQKEKDADRIKALQHISAKWLTLRDEAYRFLRNT